MNIDLLKILQDLLGEFAAAIPSIVGAIAVVVIGWIIARLLARLVKKLLKTIGVDKLMEKLNEIEIVYNSKIKIVPSVLLSKIVYYFLFFIFLVAATEVLGMAAVSELMGNIMNYIPILISAMIVFVIGIFIADFLKNMVLTACKSLGVPSAALIANIVFYFIFLNIIMITLAQAQINTEFIQDNLSIILAGAVLAFAIGYGFASRDIIANFLASFYNKEKVKIGDVITIDGFTGEIIDIDSTSITLQSDEKEIIIPLRKLTSDIIEIIKK